MGLIVDTCEFVDLERTGGTPADIIGIYGASEAYAVSVVTVAELRHGVRRADSPSRMKRRQNFLDSVLENFAVFPIDVDIALPIGDLDAILQMNGTKRDLPDLMIAATAIELDFAVATKNLKHFDGIPDLRIANASRSL